MNIQITPSRICGFLAALCFFAGLTGAQLWGMTEMRWALLGWLCIAAGIVLG